MGKQARLAPDPSVGVHDLCKAFNELCEKSGCRDLAKILYSKERVTWKTAADGSWLGSDSLCDLYTSLFAIHSNGVLSSKKVKSALLKLQAEKGRLNFTKQHDADWADAMDELIRIGAAQFRELRRDSVKYNRCVRKCSHQEKNIDTVLGHLTLEENLEKGTSFDSSQAAALQSPPPKLSLEDEPEEISLGLKIFDRVLQKKTSDPASPNFKAKETEEAVGGSASSLQETQVADVQQQQSSSSSSWKHLSLSDLELGENEAAELQAWMTQGASDKPKKRKSKKMKKPAAAAQKKQTKKAMTKKKPRQASYKSSFLQRATSSAYHKAKLKALKDGKDEDAAKEVGKAASAKVRQDIKDGVLQEE